MLLEFVRTADGKLLPAGEETQKHISKIGVGETVFFDYKPKRNYENHKRFFSMLQEVLNNQEHYKSVDNLLDIIKLRVGHFDTFVSHRGKPVYIPKSIDFSKMDEAEFKEFFSKAIDICIEIVGDKSMEMILRYL